MYSFVLTKLDLGVQEMNDDQRENESCQKEDQKEMKERANEEEFGDEEIKLRMMENEELRENVFLPFFLSSFLS